jgi:predicted ATP-binding protein involved in virulence
MTRERKRAKQMLQEDVSKPKRIRQISVANLFGIFNHIIPLKMTERITIIHGPNGFGKTMMLKLLNALFSQSNHFLQTVPFDVFKVDFEDNTSFWISKTSRLLNSTEEKNSSESGIYFHSTGRKAYQLHSKFLLKDASLSLIDRLILPLDRVGPEVWRDITTNELLSLGDVVERFGDRLPADLIDEKTKTPEWLIDIRRSIPIRLIETQRLLSSPPPPKRKTLSRTTQEYAVTEDSRHLVEVISKKLAESATLSQSLDRTFPVRLISPTTQQLQITEDELRDKLGKLEQKRSRLTDLGLLDKETESTFPIGNNQRIANDTKAVLAIYAEDTERKLGIFNELAQKINLLTTIINNRFLYKTMTIHKEEGIVFTTKNGTILPLENLSSGEQHELVLFYELLFRVTPGSLILIDEPELSLHVVWQEQFLKDLQQVTQLTDIDIILATHSPDIISDRRDLVVELEEP